MSGEVLSLIHIFMLASQMSNFRTPAKCSTNTLMFVQCHADTFTTSAESNTRVTLSGFSGQCQGMSKICIVAALRCVGAEVFVFPSFSFQPPLDLSLIHI